MAMRRLTETPEDRDKRLGKRPAEVDEAQTPEATRRTPVTPAARAYRGAETSHGWQRRRMATIPESPEKTKNIQPERNTPWGL